MPWRLQSEPTAVERIVGGISYLTAGIAGMLYMLLSKGSGQSTQFRFHTFQSMFLTIILVLFEWGTSFLQHIMLPLFSLAGPHAGGTLAMTAGSLITILTKAFDLLLIYGAVMAFLGKFAEVPFISNIVRHNMRA